ncbi:hypothetical protein [Flaviaesturariibacter amylovorans]|uniref:Zinc ribbon domain-containing protein n=1 Tax=Flaviaesturariibacter amylovorans TaxID=1084520 RepID=A0ABP8GC02_9BACT
MECSRCGSANAATHHYCAFCGSLLRQGAPGPEGAVLFPDAPRKERPADTGFLLLAASFLLVGVLYYTWTHFGAKEPEGAANGYRMLSILTLIINAAEFAIMAVFTRRTGYRLAIVACGVLFTILQFLLYLPFWTSPQ